MTWDYRLVRRLLQRRNGTAEPYYAIHEVYYDADGKPDSMAQDPAPVLSETAVGACQTLVLMGQALVKPVLDYETREPVEMGAVFVDRDFPTPTTETEGQ